MLKLGHYKTCILLRYTCIGFLNFVFQYKQKLYNYNVRFEKKILIKDKLISLFESIKPSNHYFVFISYRFLFKIIHTV